MATGFQGDPNRHQKRHVLEHQYNSVNPILEAVAPGPCGRSAGRIQSPFVKMQAVAVTGLANALDRRLATNADKQDLRA
jgi:hypothetical protein